MTDIDVAIAIVTYRCADLTIDCLHSIQKERSTHGVRIRAVVVDNASGDAPFIKKIIAAQGWSSWVTVIVSPINGGYGYGNNAAFECIYGVGPPDYLYILNPDTRLFKGAISKLVHFLESHPHVGIVGNSSKNLDGSQWRIAFRFPSILSELEAGLQLSFATRILKQRVVAYEMNQIPEPCDWIGGASMMVRREVVDSIGGFDENYFLYFEEIDFCLRARKAGFATWYVPDSLVMHIGGQSTKIQERNAAPKRLPLWWFESRRRYFAVHHGIGYAVTIDVVALVSNALGALKRVVLRRTKAVPYFLADLAQHSVLWPKNRKIPAIKTFKPRV